MKTRILLRASSCMRTVNASSSLFRGILSSNYLSLFSTPTLKVSMIRGAGTDLIIFGENFINDPTLQLFLWSFLVFVVKAFDQWGGYMEIELKYYRLRKQNDHSLVPRTSILPSWSFKFLKTINIILPVEIPKNEKIIHYHSISDTKTLLESALSSIL